MPATSHSTPSPDRHHAPKRIASTTICTLRVSGFTTACRSPALAFSAVIHSAMKRSAPCSAVLCHSPSSWAAVRPLIDVDAESSEVVHPGNIPSTLFPGPPHSPRPSPFLRTSRTSAVSYLTCAPQTSRTRSASCVKSPRCSHFPS